MESRFGEVIFSGPFDGGLDAAFDFDLGFKNDFGKEADLGGGVKPAVFATAVAAAASESSSCAILKNGLSLSKSSILAWAPGGGAFAADFVAGGDFTSGAPFGLGFSSADGTDGVTVESAGKATSPFVESCPEEVEVGKAVETRGVLSATSSGSDPKSTSSCGAGGEGGTSAFASTGVVDILLNLSSTSDKSTGRHGSASDGMSLSAGLSVKE